MELGKFLAVATLVEALVNAVKLVYDPEKRQINYDVIATLVVSILLSVAVGADLFTYLGFTIPYPFVGSILTGVLLSRGATIVHDLVTMIQSFGGSSIVIK